jgi:hypothetical protein
MNEPDDQKKARIVAARVARAEKLKNVVERQKKNLAKKKNVQRNFSKHDVKPKINPVDKEKLCRQFLKQLRSEEAEQLRPEYFGMVIGMMVAAAKTPEMKGLILGLSGLEINEENQNSAGDHRPQEGESQ